MASRIALLPSVSLLFARRTSSPAVAVRSFATVKNAVDKEDVLTPYDTTLYRRGGGYRSSVSGVTAVVFGCTGYLGRHVVNELGKSGTQVIIPYRNDEQEYRHLKVMGDLGQIVPMKFNLRDSASIQRCIENADVVINCLGKRYETRNFTYEDVHVAGAKSVAKAARDAGVKRLIHVSGVNLSENAQSGWVSSKARGEKAVLEEFPGATIIRPTQLIGFEDNFLRRWGIFLERFGVLPIVHPHTRIQPVYVNDVARAISKCLLHPEMTMGQTYELGGSQIFTQLEFAQYLHELTDRGTVVPLPSFVADWVFSVLETRVPVLNWDPIFTRDQIRQQEVDQVADPQAQGFEDLDIELTPHDLIIPTCMVPFRWRAETHNKVQFVGQAGGIKEDVKEDHFAKFGVPKRR